MENKAIEEKVKEFDEGWPAYEKDPIYGAENKRLRDEQKKFLRQALTEIYTQGKQDAVKEILELRYYLPLDDMKYVAIEDIERYAQTLTTSKE